jgi:hypothetical protein
VKGISDMSGTAATGSGRAMREASEIQLETQLKTARDKVARLYARWQELELLQKRPVSLDFASCIISRL